MKRPIPLIETSISRSGYDTIPDGIFSSSEDESLDVSVKSDDDIQIYYQDNNNNNNNNDNNNNDNNNNNNTSDSDGDMGYGPIYAGSNGNDDDDTNEKLIDQTPDIPGYEFIKLLGKGVFGAVWEVVNKDGKKSALKIIKVKNTDQLKNLMREVEILTKISDPLCQPFLACFNGYQYLKDRKEFLIEMELVEGKNLSEYANSVFTKETKYRHLLLIMKDIVKALIYLHNNGIIHNDVKPDNIIVDKNLTPVLVDFGVSCTDLNICPLDKNTESLCCTGVIGPNLYRSPETVESRAYFFESDVWSLGVSFYVVVSLGSHPLNIYSKTTPKNIDKAILKREARKLNTSNQLLNTIVNRALDKNPTTRITLTEISKMLNNI